MTSPLSFDELRDANLLRQNGSFPSCQYWSATDWATALAGEVGETCNLIKKLRRACLDHFDYNQRQRPDDASAVLLRASQIEEIGKELADVITYADLLAWHFGLDLGEQVRSKFNEVSDRRGSEVKL